MTIFSYSQAKKLSPQAEISIITAGPGKVLFEGFGHSTIRVQDKELAIDLAYNYGVFDFNAPNFYVNFVKGNLFYKLEKYPFHYFVRGYNRQQRWIKEQVLNLSLQEKQQFFDFLENNAKPKNAFYSYDPFFNNCASKLRGISDLILKDQVDFSDSHIINKESFRVLMNKELPWNTWGNLGINIALGSKLDQIASEKEYMYLPDYVYVGFKNATIFRNGVVEPFVKNENDILTHKESKAAIPPFNPLLLFSIFLLIGLAITYFDIGKKRRTRWFDFLLFFITGIFGLLILFLWFFTNHSTAPNNFNFLWAFAPNLLAAFFILKKSPRKWVKQYIYVLLILLIITPIIWIGEIQLFAKSLIPFLVLLFVRYIALIKILLPSKK